VRTETYHFGHRFNLHTCRRWQRAVVELVACHQLFELRRFLAVCEAVATNLEHRDALVRAKNEYGLNPPWYTSLDLNDPERPPLGNTDSRSWAPAYPISAAPLLLDNPRPKTPPPL